MDKEILVQQTAFILTSFHMLFAPVYLFNLEVLSNEIKNMLHSDTYAFDYILGLLFRLGMIDPCFVTTIECFSCYTNFIDL